MRKLVVTVSVLTLVACTAPPKQASLLSSIGALCLPDPSEAPSSRVLGSMRPGDDAETIDCGDDLVWPCPRKAAFSASGLVCRCDYDSDCARAWFDAYYPTVLDAWQVQCVAERCQISKRNEPLR